MRAKDLAVSNAELTLAVTRLEAFAEIARAVGGETELRTVLDRILEHGRAIVEARTLVAYLEQDGELGGGRGHRRAAAAGTCRPRASGSTEDLIESRARRPRSPSARGPPALAGGDARRAGGGRDRSRASPSATRPRS